MGTISMKKIAAHLKTIARTFPTGRRVLARSQHEESKPREDDVDSATTKVRIKAAT